MHENADLAGKVGGAWLLRRVGDECQHVLDSIAQRAPWVLLPPRRDPQTFDARLARPDGLQGYLREQFIEGPREERPPEQLVEDPGSAPITSCAGTWTTVGFDHSAGRNVRPMV